jgi:hypothetical protein
MALFSRSGNVGDDDGARSNHLSVNFTASLCCPGAVRKEGQGPSSKLHLSNYSLVYEASKIFIVGFIAALQYAVAAVCNRKV